MAPRHLAVRKNCRPGMKCLSPSAWTSSLVAGARADILANPYATVLLAVQNGADEIFPPCWQYNISRREEDSNVRPNLKGGALIWHEINE